MAVSIEITSKEVLAVVGNVGKTAHALSAFCAPLGSDFASRGIINNQIALCELVQKMLKKHNIDQKQVIVTLSCPAVIYRNFSGPLLNKKQLRLMLAAELDQLNHNVHQTTDYIVLNDGKTAPDKLAKLMAIAVPEVLSNSYLELVTNLKLKPLALDVTGNVLYKAILTDPAVFSDCGAVIVAHIDYDQMTLILVSKNGDMFCRSHVFDVKRPIADDDDEFIITTAAKPKVVEEAFDIETLTNSVASNISAMMQFASVQIESGQTIKVQICSQLASDYDLAEPLAAMLDTPVSEISPLAGVTFAEGVDCVKYFSTAAALIRR